VSIYVYALRIKKAIDPILIGEEVSYIPNRGVGVEAKLADDYNCTICTCWIYYNGRDHWR